MKRPLCSLPGRLLLVLAFGVSCTKPADEDDLVPQCSLECPDGTRRTTFDAVVRGAAGAIKSANCETYCEPILSCVAPNVPVVTTVAYSCKPLEGFADFPKDDAVDLTFVQSWDADWVTVVPDGESPKTCTNGKLDQRTGSNGELLPGRRETDLDCGGPDCLPCAMGKRCSAHGDCAGSGYTCDGHVCGGFLAPQTVAGYGSGVLALYPVDETGDGVAEKAIVFTSAPPALAAIDADAAVGSTWSLASAPKLLSFASFLESDGVTRSWFIATNDGSTKASISRLDPGGVVSPLAEADVDGTIAALAMVRNFTTNDLVDLVVAYAAGGLGLIRSTTGGAYGPATRYANTQAFDRVLATPNGIVAAGTGGLLLTRGNSADPIAELYPMTTEPVTALRASSLAVDVLIGMRDQPEVRGYSFGAPSNAPALRFTRAVAAAPVTAVDSMALGASDSDYTVAAACGESLSVTHEFNTESLYRFDFALGPPAVRSIVVMAQGTTAAKALWMDAGGKLVVAKRLEK